MSRKKLSENQKYLKKFVLLITSIMLMSCNSNKIISNKIISNNKCPIDGICELKYLKNKGLIIKKDSLNNVTFELIDNFKTNVFLYTYEGKNDKNIQDDGYREEIIFEIPSDAKNLKFENEALQTTKMIFGRFCYCKGFTGYYKIDSGKLTMESTNKKNTVILDFVIKKVPQTLKNISFTYKI